MCSQPLARRLHGVAHFNGFIQRCSQARHLPGKEGLMHISEYEWGHPETLEGVIHVGDELLTSINLIQRCSPAYHQVKVIALPHQARQP